MQIQEKTLMNDIPFLAIDPTECVVRDKSIASVIKKPIVVRKKKPIQAYMRSIDDKVGLKVIAAPISGSYFIRDTPSLLDYCLKWCKSVYPNKVIFRSIQNTGTLLMVVPNDTVYFIQFIYGKDMQNMYQKDFQYHINPTEILIFKTFPAFQEFVNAKNI